MIQVFEYVEPFITTSGKKNRRRTLREYTGRPGVYFIRGAETGELLYVGMSQSRVVEALYRHFYIWSDHRGSHYRTVYRALREGQAWKVAIFPTTKEQAPLVERAFIISLNPRDNRERYEWLMSQTPKQEEAVSEPVPEGDDCPF